jgi:hypothetical protein
MESKGRRALRAARPSTNQAEAVPPAKTQPVSAKPMESAAEEVISAEPAAKGVMPTSATMAPPGVEAPAVAAKTPSSGGPSDFGREAFAAFVQSQTAVARGLEALGAEMTGLALSRIDAAARTATGMLAVKTLSDAIELNAGFTRSSIDALVGGSAKLSELGVKLVAEASQPILTQLSRGWSKGARSTF